MTGDIRTLAGVRLLLAEDEFVLADAWRCAFEAQGVSVVGLYAKAATAVAALDVQTVDVAVIDYDLGGTPCLPLIDALDHHGIPYVVVSGYDTAALPARFAGATHCLKPVRFADLVKAVQRALASRPRRP